MSDWYPVRARLGIMLLMASCLLPGVAGAREISGTVKHAVAEDTLGKLPLACGRIDEPWPELRVQNASFLARIDWTEKATDDEGRFSFTAEADGRWIIVTRDSHYTFPRGYVVVTLGPGESPAPLDLVVCDGARREVSVFGPDGRTPLDHPENIRLVMDPTNPEIRPDMYVLKPALELPLARIVGKYQGDGVMVLGPAPPGYYELYSTPDDGFRFAKVDQRVDRSLEGAPLQWKEWRKRTLRCMPVPLLQAKFVLPDGSPAVGAEANLLTQPNWMNGLRTDANGVLRFDQDEQLPLGNVRISMPGYAGVYKPEQFSTDPAAAPWMLEVDNAPPAEGKVVTAAEVTQDAFEEITQAAIKTFAVKDCQGFPLADAVVTVRPMENSPEKVPAMTLRSDVEGRVTLPYSASPYVYRIAHEAYAEYIGFTSIQDWGAPDSVDSITLPCAGKVNVSVLRGGQPIEDANVVSFATGYSLPAMQAVPIALGKYTITQAAADSNSIAISVFESLGEAEFLRTRFASFDVPIHGEVTVATDLAAPRADVLLEGDTSSIEAVMFDLRGENRDEHDIYRWKHESENLAARLSGLPAGSGNVYISYGEAGFDYLPVELVEGKTTSIAVGRPDMLSVRYKLNSPVDFQLSKVVLVAKPTFGLCTRISAVPIDSPITAGGCALAAREITNPIDVVELRVPRGLELEFSVEETWKDAGLKSAMPDYTMSHRIGNFTLTEDTDLNVLEDE